MKIITPISLLIYLLSLGTFIYCSDFSSFISYNKEVNQSVNELKEIISTFPFQSLFSASESWEYRDTGLAYDSYLLINSFNLTEVKLNLNNLNGIFNPYVEITSGNNQVFELSFQFNYIGRTSYLSKSYGSGTIKVCIFSSRYLIFNLSSIKENYQKTLLLLL